MGKSERMTSRGQGKRENQRHKNKLKLMHRIPCVICGQIPNEFAHIHDKPTMMKSWGRGSVRRINDLLKNPKNYVPLCKSCHKRYDRNEIGVPTDVSFWSLLQVGQVDH